MDTHNTVEVQELPFENLCQIEDLQKAGDLIQTYIKGHNWTYSYNCITELRKINKYHPEYVPDIIERYSPIILDLWNNGKPLMVKNILKLIKEIFDAGQNINVEKAVYSFLPVLIKKASTDIGSMKILAQQVLTSFTSNCGYEISLTISCEFCCDKNSAVAELSIKLLAALIEKVGSGVMQLSQNTLQILIKSLSFLVDGKRQNLKNSSLDICWFIYESIGSDNFLMLIQYCLKQEEARSMGSSMQSYKQNKQKPMSLKQAIRSRRTEAFNADFFKVERVDVPPNQKQINYNYNYNQNNFNSINQFNQHYF